MESCLIQAEENDTLIQEVKRICEKHGITAYNEERNKGTLRHVMARYGQVTGEIMLVFITRTAELPNKKQLLKKLREIPRSKINCSKRKYEAYECNFRRQNDSTVRIRIHL